MHQLHIKQPHTFPSNNHTLIQRLWFIKPVLKLWAGLALSWWMTQTTTAESMQKPTKSHGDKPDWMWSGFLKKRLCCICESGLQGGIQYLNSSVLHHTDTYIHTKSQGTFKTQNTTCTLPLVWFAALRFLLKPSRCIRTGNIKHSVSMWSGKNKVLSANEMSSSTVIQWV